MLLPRAKLIALLVSVESEDKSSMNMMRGNASWESGLGAAQATQASMRFLPVIAWSVRAEPKPETRV
jgi:hypothetical protein